MHLGFETDSFKISICIIQKKTLIANINGKNQTTLKPAPFLKMTLSRSFSQL